MKARLFPGAVALALGLLAVPAPAVAGDEYKCTAGTQECLDKMAAYYRKVGWVGIEQKWVDSSRTMEVLKVVPESPASKAGFQVGDHISAMNGVTFTPENEEKLKAMQELRKPGARFEFTLMRDGKEKVVSVVLGRMPDDIIATQIGYHMLEHVTPEPKSEKTAKKNEKD